MTSAIALLLILIGGFAMILVGSCSMLSQAAQRNGRAAAEAHVNRRLGLALVIGLVLLLAGWWLA